MHFQKTQWIWNYRVLFSDATLLWWCVCGFGQLKFCDSAEGHLLPLQSLFSLFLSLFLNVIKIEFGLSCYQKIILLSIILCFSYQRERRDSYIIPERKPSPSPTTRHTFTKLIIITRSKSACSQPYTQNGMLLSTTLDVMPLKGTRAHSKVRTFFRFDLFHYI